MATYSDKFSSGWATLYLVVTESEQSIANNKTKLKCVLKIKKNSSCSSYNSGGASISMTINGTKLYSSSSFDIRSLSVGSTKTLTTETITVSHDSEGKKSVTCKASFKSGVGLGSASISDTFKCTTIPRASTVSLSASNIEIGQSITANITRKSTSFTHDVVFYTSTRTFASYTNVSTSQTFVLDSPDWYTDMPSSPSCTAYCKVTTKSGGSTIGNPVTKSFTVKVPEDICPTVGNLTITPGKISIGGVDYENVLVQNKNELTASVGTCAAGTGSSIDSYIFSGPGFPETAISTSDTTATVSISSVSSYGELAYTVTVKDKRGRSATTPSKVIECYQYYNPSFKPGSFNAYRVVEQEDGSYIADPNGKMLLCKWTPVIASVGGRNTCYAVITYTCNGVTKSTDPIYGDHVVIDLGESDKTYSVTATLTDGFGATVSSTENSEPITVNGSARILNIANNSLGLAIGKMSSVDDDYEGTNGLFECAWDADFLGDVSIKGDSLTKLLSDLAHPVGSVLITSTNKNPSETLGGTWELVNKSFKPGSVSSNSEYFTNSSNISSSSVYVTRAGNSIRIRLQTVLTAAVVDDEVNIGTFKYNAIGITSLPFGLYQYPCGCDARDAAMLCTIAWDTGEIKAVQSLPETNSTTESNMYLDVTFLLNLECMLDDFCNEFHWQRIE